MASLAVRNVFTPGLPHRFLTRLPKQWTLRPLAGCLQHSVTEQHFHHFVYRPKLMLPSSIQLTSIRTKKSKAKEKKKDKHDKTKKGGHGKKVSMHAQLSEEELSEIINHEKMKHQLELALNNLKQEYIEQLSLRTSAGLFDNLMVETPDGKFPLIQLAQVAQKGPQTIMINMVAVPQYIPEVKEALMTSGMNLNPQQDGTTLFIPIPKVTREHREQLSTNAKALFNKTKDKMRDIQNTFVRDCKKAKDHHSQDLLHNVQEYVYATGQDYMLQAEDLMHTKQFELLGDK